LLQCFTVPSAYGAAATATAITAERSTCTPDIFCKKKNKKLVGIILRSTCIEQIRMQMSQVRVWVLGLAQNHIRKGREGIGVLVGCLSPAKAPKKTWAPGVGRRRRPVVATRERKRERARGGTEEPRDTGRD